MNDSQYAARVLAKSPGFTLAIVALLSIGIGASAVIFSAFDTVLLRPLPVVHAEQLVRMVEKVPEVGTRSDFEYSFYRELSKRSTTLASVFAEMQLAVAMNEPAPSEVVRVGLPTPEFFGALGVPALYGRTLTAADADETSTELPAVLSYSFWRRHFNGDTNAIGRTIRLHGHPFVIVGVTPATFNGVSVETSPDVRVPLHAYSLLTNPDSGPMEKFAIFEVGARLKPEMTISSAQPECLAIWREATQDYYRNTWNLPQDLVDVYLRRGMELDPLNRGVSILRERFSGALKLLIVAAGLLLMLVSANVAGLLLARNATRRQEMAVRLAVGATRWRLARQLLIENIVLTLGGITGGLIIAAVSGPLLVRALPPMRDPSTAKLTLTVQLGVDWRVFLFVLAVSGLTALLFGLSPALTASRTSIDSILRRSRAAHGWRGRQFAVAIQIAVCTVLLMGTALLVRTLYELRSTNPGFDRDHVVTASINPGLAGYTAAQTSTFRAKLLERVRVLPSVQRTAAALIGVMRGSGVKAAIAPAGERGSAELNASLNAVSSDYFDVMGMRILSGRALTNFDSASKIPIPVVVNETFARKFFPNTIAVGKLFGTASTGIAQPQYEIVGVVTDAKYRSVREQTPATYYGPLKETAGFQLVVRSQVRPESLLEPIRREVAALDPNVPISETHTLSEEVDSSIAGERLTVQLVSIFGILAASLAAVGLYGLLAHVVNQRQQEIGIRMALGAAPANIAALIGRQAFALVGAGVLLGLTIALLAGSGIRSLLFGVAPTDFLSMVSATAFIFGVAALAAAGPTIRSARIQPALTLRQEN